MMNATPFAVGKTSIVKERYAAAANRRQEALCCPVEYDRKLLEVIPAEVIEKDYGCGDPARFLKPGETVLDLGSGAGKICFMAAQIVGPRGRVLGVDMTDEMLEVARRNAPLVADRLGYANVEFRKGRIEDLALDLELFGQRLRQHPIQSVEGYLAAEDLAEELRKATPLIPSHSMDVVISNCVLNLVAPRRKRQLFEELYRALKPGGRAIISDILADKEAPLELQQDPELWSGCISGALTETEFLEAFKRAGFHGMQILNREAQAWRIVQGIEFRSFTIAAYKAEPGEERECDQAVVYRGPFLEVVDDSGRRLTRGRRVAVSSAAFHLYQSEPYIGHFAFIDPTVDASDHKQAPGQQRCC